MGAAIVIARIIGLAVIWHLVRQYLVPSETHMDKPQTRDEKQKKGNTGTVEGIHNYDEPILCALGNGAAFNSNAFDALEWRKSILDNVMDALADPNTHLIGVYGSDDEIKDTLLERVCRRVKREKLFDMVLTANVTKKPDVNKIQEEIACQLGFNCNEKSKDRRASDLLHRIKNEQKILIVLCDLCKKFDLGKVGIPFGADHTSCKILLTSKSEEVLSNQMHTQISFVV